MRFTILVLILLGFARFANADDRPNILLIVSEDNGPELGCYGDKNASTPVLDQLAEDGVRFSTAYVPFSVCSPSRACFLTGLYPHQNGQLGLATHKFAMYEDTPTLPAILQTAGYRTGMIGKLHVNPADAFPFNFRKITGANFGRRNMREYADAAAEFFHEESDSPFCLSINYPDAHFPLHRQQFGLPVEPIEPEDVTPLPWMGIDTPRLRQFTADYYNCLRRLDDGIGMLLEELDQSGHSDNTLVVYIGDHGAQFSRGKCTVYEAGLRIPMIVRYPAKQATGTVRDELVTTLDLMPMFLEVADIEVPSTLPGQSLLSLVRNRDVDPEAWERYIVAMTTGAAPSIFFLQHSIRDSRYKLISSPLSEFEPHSRFAHAYLHQMNSHFAAGCTEEEIASASELIQVVYRRFLHPPRYELYDLKSDPYEFHDLADSPEHAEIKAEMIFQLNRWQLKTRDPFQDEQRLVEFAREVTDAIDTNYRQDRSFRWSYIDRFAPQRGEHPEQR